jgi:hypothetical protein
VCSYVRVYVCEFCVPVRVCQNDVGTPVVGPKALLAPTAVCKPASGVLRSVVEAIVIESSAKNGIANCGNSFPWQRISPTPILTQGRHMAIVQWYGITMHNR